MYSDMIESPSKDCFSFNDQSSPYDMAEVNEINNQTSLDYIFDSYYSSVSRYNTDFELSEDCKNMSFSELFDQELFSTHVSENKDCQITIKIEKEEPLNECFSADNSTDTTGSQSFEKIEDNLSSLSKSFAPKRGINRTFIKTSKTSDVKHLIHNPFCETDIYSPIIKCEPEVVSDNVEESFVEIEINPYYSADKVQNNVNLEKCEDIVVSSMPSKSSTPKGLGINRISIKTSENCDVEHHNNSFGEPKDLGDHEISVKIQTPIIKCEPMNINNTFEEINEILHYSADDSNYTSNSRNMDKVVDTSYGTESTTNSHNMVRAINSVTPLILKKSTPKHRQINITSTKTPKNGDAKHFYNNFCEPKNLDDHQISVKIQTPIIKCEPVDINDTIKVSNSSLHYSTVSKNTAYSRNMVKVKKNLIKYGSQSTTNSHKMVKVIDSVTPLLLKNSTSKRQVNNKTSLKTTINKLPTYSKTKHLGVNQVSVKVNTPIVKSELEENDTIKKPIVKISRNFEDIVSSSLLKTSIAKRRANQTKHIKATENSVVKNITYKLQCEPKKSGNDQISEKIKMPIIKQEPEDFNGTSEETIEINPYYSYNGLQNTSESQSLVKIDEIVLLSSSKDFSPQHRSAKISSIKTTDNSDEKNQIIYNLNYEPKDLGNSITSAKVQMPTIKSENNSAVEINVNIEKETKCIDHNNVHSVDLINGNSESQKLVPQNTDTTVLSFKADDIDFQTDKKKISWEEFRAKREKMGLINISEIKEEPVTDFVATDNLKMKAMQEEFDRNTAEHFTGQKRKIDDDKEEQTTITKEINNEEEELQKKRINIEYFKKLSPSSFASEIIKTSSMMKGTLVEDNDNESTSDDSMMSNDKTQGKYSNTRDRFLKKGYQSRVHSSYHSSSRSDYNNKSSRSSSISSNSDDYYNRNRTDAPTQGQYGQSARTTLQRPKEQKRVVYIGQIPIRLGKRYLYNRFKEFGTIQSLTLHKKPEFRVYYAFVTYSENSEADRAISHGNDDESEVQLDIRFGERKQTQTPYYDLDDEWLTDWYGYNQPLAPVVRAQSPEKVSYEEQLQEFYKLAQSKKSNQIKSSQVS